MTKEIKWSEDDLTQTAIRMGGDMKPGEIWIVQATEAGYGTLLGRLSPETKVSFWCRLKFAWLALWPKSKALVRI